ncbi:MAG: riboflavin synthase [Proteobacteria bacterium]|nr:riboflavin synthase [Pseudomonadota bacterium]
MFNGIVQGLGTVEEIRESRGHRRLTLAWQEDLCSDIAALDDVRPGSSLAVNGACLTVVEKYTRSVEVELSPRTLELTNLGAVAKGSLVNLETSLKMGASIDGHLLSGHVDGVGCCRLDAVQGDGLRLVVTIPEALRKYVAENGALAVNGVSLTVNQISSAGCTLTIVPYTRTYTTFRTCGDNKAAQAQTVNLEVDLLARYVHAGLNSDQWTDATPTPRTDTHP